MIGTTTKFEAYFARYKQLHSNQNRSFAIATAFNDKNGSLSLGSAKINNGSLI